MNSATDDISENVLERLAKRLWKCPFDQKLFNSPSRLRLHLVESHEGDICQRRRLPQQVPLGNVENPTKLTFCGHCLDCMVPDAPDRHPVSEIARHIREKHPNPLGPSVMTFTITTDSTLIRQLMDEQTCPVVCACNASDCGELFSHEDLVAGHWIEKHCSNATVQEARHLVETDPERFGPTLEECLAGELVENHRLKQSGAESEDGYMISHCPIVPRVRSRPSECIVYIERERVRFFDDELEELLEYEILDFGSDKSSAEIWNPGRHQTITIDLRFCNILDGYIPLIREMRGILPPLPDGGMIEVSWQDEPQKWFPCKVSQKKRAIYNLENRLKDIFSRLDSSVRLYITRVGVRRYQLHLKHQPHIVRNCKFFLPQGECRWRVEVKDQQVEWETGDEVFRHQLTFKQMEALREEARRTNLSVRDAVYEAMKQLAQREPVHVKAVYEMVFLQMRTCSLAAVWAQFRPEHECYKRVVPVVPGWYRFDPSKPLPSIRFLSAASRSAHETLSVSGGSSHAPATRIRILVHWSEILKKPCPDEEVFTHNSGVTQARFLGSLIREFGPKMAERLTVLPVSRAYPLSSNPKRDFVNTVAGNVYAHKLVPGTGTELYLFTTTGNGEKRDDILRLAERLGLPVGSVEVFIIPGLSRANLLDSF